MIVKNTEDDRKCVVRTRGQYRFTVIRTGKGWLQGHLNPKGKLTKANDELATKVCKLIDSRRGS